MCHQFAFLLSTVFFCIFTSAPKATPQGCASSYHIMLIPRAHDTSSRLPLFHLARTTFPGRSHGAQIEPSKVDVPYCQGKHRSATARENPRPIPLNSKKRYCKQLMTHQLRGSGSGIFATTGCCPTVTFPCGYFLNLQLRRSAVTPH
ncbi:hypothetical protein EDB19DRAFT_505457 [Suillus lakei]|nr:hypothetical protein EDB19DRAFT_505457 [Suillus lakei]